MCREVFKFSGAPSVEVIGVNGFAFYADNAIEILDNKRICFRDVSVASIQCKWFSSNPGFREERNLSVNPCDYDAVLLLDPLFLTANFFRNKLISKNYICSYIDASLRKPLMERCSGNFHLISRSQFLECYRRIRVLNLKMFQYFFRESIAKKVYLVPHVLPPMHQGVCEYGSYNIGEQKLISEFALKEFGIKTLPAPSNSVVATDSGFTCAEEYLAPYPDLHHPTPIYYKSILNAFLGISSS